MESLPEYMNHVWPEYNLHVPFPAEVEAGFSMYDKSHFHFEPGEVERYKEQFLRSKGIEYTAKV